MVNLFFSFSHLDGPIVVDGDSFVLKDTPATYTVSLPNDYPGYVTFKYVFSLDLPKPRKDTILAGRSTSWQCDFTNVTVGNYNLNIQVYLQLMTLGWKIGEKKIAINVKGLWNFVKTGSNPIALFTFADNLNDFFAIEGAQEGLPSYTTNYFFATNRTVNITAKLAEQNTYLAEPSTRYNFTWTLKSKTLNETTYKARTFNYSFIKAEDYDVSLNISAAFQLNGNEMHLVGHLATPFYVRIPLTIANLTFHGNNYVKNGQLLNLNISWCGASANYQFCYDFSYGNVSNTTCFDSPITLRQCYYNIRHYFPHNGTQYVNFGVRNDVSEIATAVKITIYKGLLRCHPILGSVN